jgi:serine/threonine protein kinase
MKPHANLLDASADLRTALGYYRLVAEIGRGGMASVHLALFPDGNGAHRDVVLKQLHPELAIDDDFRTMFEDEARVATRLHHDNVVETYDIYSDGGLCVLVMEFLDGQTLSRVRQRAHRVHRIPLSLHLRVLAEVLGGLHYVHELTDGAGKPLGIVHRDVTPSNVFVTYDGRVKVVDFGIAKATSCVAETRIGVLKGKLAYMSPEAARGEPVDRRHDIFSVGVMLWEAATGLRLWQDHDEVAIYRRLAAGDLPVHSPAAQIRHPELLRIAKRAIAVDPCRRYANADEMKRELEDLLVVLGRAAQASALAAYMESSFAEEREKFQAMVDRALTRVPRPTVSQRRRVARELRDSYRAMDAPKPPTEASISLGQTFRTTSYDVSPDTREAPCFHPRKYGFLVAAAAAATLAVSVAFAAHLPARQQDGWLWSALHASNATPSGVSPGATLPVADPSIARDAEPPNAPRARSVDTREAPPGARRSRALDRDEASSR